MNQFVQRRNPLVFLRLLAAFAVFLAAAAAGLAAHRAQAAPAARQTEPLIVVTKPVEPFVFADGGELRGFSIDLWRAVALEAGIDYEFTVVETVNEALDSVRNGESDIAIAAFTITDEREATLDFSVPYYRAGLGILTHSSVQPSPLDAAFSALTPTLFYLVLLLIGVIIIAGHIIWLIERGRNDDFPQDYLHGVWQGIWWAAVTVTTVGYGDKTPKRVLGRVFGLLWMFAGLFIIANFTAAVTATLTAQQLSAAIDGPEDLPGRRVVTVAGTSSDEWLTRNGIIHQTTTTIDEAYALLESSRVDAVVYDFPVIQYYVLNQDNPDLILVGEPFNIEFYGIALQQGSTHTEDVNRALLRLVENGGYDAIHLRWFGSTGGL